MQDANSNEYEGRSVGGVVGNKEKQIEPSSAAGHIISTAKFKYEKTFSKIKVKQLFESFLDFTIFTWQSWWQLMLKDRSPLL